MKQYAMKFRFYGDFHEINYIYGDCSADMFYVGNSEIDASPIFVYYHNLDTDMVNDVNKLNIYLRELKIRKITKNDLTVDEKSVYTFFRFYLKSKDQLLLKVMSNNYNYSGYKTRI